MIPKLENKKRLIVLVPDSLAGNVDFAHRIYKIATSEYCDVLYLTLVDDDEKLISVSRSMATMKAITAGQWVVVNSMMTDTHNWLKNLRELYRPGDIIVCHEEQVVQTGFLNTQPIADFLSKTLHTPIKTVSGYYHPQQVQIKRWVNGLLFWLGSLLIFVAFSFLEIRIDVWFKGTLQTLLLIVALVIEYCAFWIWNSVVNR